MARLRSGKSAEPVSSSRPASNSAINQSPGPSLPQSLPPPPPRQESRASTDLLLDFFCNGVHSLSFLAAPEVWRSAIASPVSRQHLHDSLQSETVKGKLNETSRNYIAALSQEHDNLDTHRKRSVVVDVIKSHQLFVWELTSHPAPDPRHFARSIYEGIRKLVQAGHSIHAVREALDNAYDTRLAGERSHKSKSTPYLQPTDVKAATAALEPIASPSKKSIVPACCILQR